MEIYKFDADMRYIVTLYKYKITVRAKKEKHSWCSEAFKNFVLKKGSNAWRNFEDIPYVRGIILRTQVFRFRINKNFDFCKITNPKPRPLE